jgi:uncharacterized protein
MTACAQWIGRAMDRLYDRMRHADAFTLTYEDAVAKPFDALRGNKYGVLVTFRRNGEAMPSPVWFAVDDTGRAFVRTMETSGKVKRIRNDARALLAPSSVRGKPTGPALRGVARVLSADEWPHAETTLAAAYGVGRRMYAGLAGDADGLSTYIEIVAAAE